MRRVLSAMVLMASIAVAGCYTCDVCDDCGDVMDAHYGMRPGCASGGCGSGGEIPVQTSNKNKPTVISRKMSDKRVN